MYSRMANTIDLAITYSCNLCCKHCNLNCNSKKGTEMPFDEVIKVLKAAEKCEVFNIYLQGGEPTIHKDFEKILRWISTNLENIKVIINTNGLELSSMAAKIITLSSNLSIVFSIYDEVMENSGLRESFYENIKKMDELGGKYGFNYLVHRKNLNKIIYTYNLFCGKGQRFNLIKYVNVKVDSTNRLDIPYKEWKKVFLKLTNEKKLGKLQKMTLLIPSCWEFYLPLEGTEFNKNEAEELWYYVPERAVTCKNCCSCGIATLFVGADLKVFPCSLLGRDNRLEIGSLSELSLTKIWGKGKTLKWFREFDFHNADGKCRDCKILELCKCGCIGLSLLGDNKKSFKDPRCPKID